MTDYNYYVLDMYRHEIGYVYFLILWLITLLSYNSINKPLAHPPEICMTLKKMKANEKGTESINFSAEI